MIAALVVRLMSSMGCTDESASVSVSGNAVLYGDNDLREFYEIDEQTWRDRVQQSTVALVDERMVLRDAGGEPGLSPDSFGERAGLCAGEPWFDQPAPAQCSGVLIDRDLVLTAAHCVRAIACPRWRVVFGFYFEAKDRLHPIADSDIYECSEVVYDEYTASGSAFEIDFAIIRLDRPVDDGRVPVRLDANVGPPADGEPLVVIGHPAGLPAKIDFGGRVVDPRAENRDYFIASSDTFRGSSGSAVYDLDGRLRGVFARGGEDYEPMSLGCQRIRQVEDDALAEEKVIHAEAIANHICGPHSAATDCSVPSGESRDRGCSLTRVRSDDTALPERGWIALSLVWFLMRRGARRQAAR